MSRAPANLREEIGKRDPFESLRQETFLNLARTASRLGSDFDALFREHGLTSPQYNALRIIAGGGETGRRCDEIGRELITRGPDVTRLVDRLESVGLVSRSRPADDRRVVLVRITEQGRRVLRMLRDEVMRLHERQFAHLTNEELATLNALLFRARHSESERD